MDKSLRSGRIRTRGSPLDNAILFFSSSLPYQSLKALISNLLHQMSSCITLMRAPEGMTFKSISLFERKLLLGKGGMGEVVLYKTDPATLLEPPSFADYRRFRHTLMERSNGFYLRDNIEARRKGFVAIKQIKRTGDGKLEQFAANDEVKFIRSITYHPNLVRIYDIFIDPVDHNLYIAMESMDKSLRRFITRMFVRGKYTIALSDVVGILGQVLMAMRHLHRNGFAHRDIKPDNVLISKRTNYYGVDGLFDHAAPSVVAKLSDYGLAKHINDSDLKRWNVGTRGYRAPELVLGLITDPLASDVWSFGSLAFKLCSGTEAIKTFGDSDRKRPEDIYQLSKTLGHPDKDFYLQPSDFHFGHWAEGDARFRKIKGGSYCHHVSVDICQKHFVNPDLEPLKKIIYSCMSWNPKERPTVEELCNDPLFAQVCSETKK